MRDLRYYMDELLLAEAWVNDIDGHRVYHITAKGEFIRLIGRTRYKELRAFLTGNDELYAWDSEALVHPEVIKSGGHDYFGVPVHLNLDRIAIRPHGLQDEYVKQMYDHVQDSDIIKRIYSGKVPPIWIDHGDDGGDFDASTHDWPEDDAQEHWSDAWGSY